jgi:hypothetical protein
LGGSKNLEVRNPVGRDNRRKKVESDRKMLGEIQESEREGEKRREINTSE